MRADRVVSLIENTYRTQGSTEQWLASVAASASAVLDSKRAMIFRYEANEHWVNSSPPALHGLTPEFAADVFNQNDVAPEVAQAIARSFLSIRFGSLRQVVEAARFVSLEAVLDRHGIEDMLAMNGLDPSGRGCMLTVAVPRRTLAARTAHLWHRLAAHISAGNRLRAALETLAGQVTPDPTAHADAILSPTGKVEHASGPAEPHAAREALRDALVRIDAARAERDDPERTVELWRGLVAGRWSLVEHFERDGRRYYLAHKNAPELTQDRTLTSRERLVLGYAELGHSNKLIAYELGLSTSTVSTILNRAKKKLGISLG